MRPLAGLRIVVTIPPYAWFGGVDFNFATEMSEELRTLGAEVFDLDLYGFIAGNELGMEQAVAALKTFDPDVAISLPNAGYALLARTPRGQNVFRDVLEIPTIMLWDHGLLQFPSLVLSPLPDGPEFSADGSIERLRAAIDHPLYVHYSPDRGHITELDRLGVISRDKVHFYLQPAYPNYVRHGYRVGNRGIHSLSESDSLDADGDMIAESHGRIFISQESFGDRYRALERQSKHPGQFADERDVKNAVFRDTPG